ncbi:PAS domain-containing protein [Sphingomonas sp. S1-29]|uniref:PAS domain-containing protein n=1 Tax=Sphingomonas sp. S1-29 TaxID=2991074 RepID=UPI00223EF60A|nr:PAS domain-containing protein [Sphingomonas sp. S1-29]UZK70137.1 PAS domain-containing protein [Sphingomonas sp. S1-29]
MAAEPLQLDPSACVTASQLVRNFGAWQERAIARPVFVMRRGQPSLVLTSFDLMRRLCSSYDATQPSTADHRALLLDAMREAVIAVDLVGDIVDTNRAARLGFAIGEAAARGRPLARLLPPAVAQFLLDQGARTRRKAATEQVDVAIAERHFSVVIAPHPDGLLLIFEDVTLDVAAESLSATVDALDEAIAMAGGVAALRLNLRGYVDPPAPPLAMLTGLAETGSASMRFVTLLDIPSRAAASDAIEATLREGKGRRLAARMIRRDAPPVPVRIGFAPQRRHLAIEAITALLVVAGAEAAVGG